MVSETPPDLRDKEDEIVRDDPAPPTSPPVSKYELCLNVVRVITQVEIWSTAQDCVPVT